MKQFDHINKNEQHTDISAITKPFFNKVHATMTAVEARRGANNGLNSANLKAALHGGAPIVQPAHHPAHEKVAVARQKILFIMSWKKTSLQLKN